MNIKKKQEKQKTMQDELTDLLSIKNLGNKELDEELQNRKIKDQKEYQKRIKFLQVKLGLQKEEGMKYDLIDQADEFLTEEQIK